VDTQGKRNVVRLADQPCEGPPMDKPSCFGIGADQGACLIDGTRSSPFQLLRADIAGHRLVVSNMCVMPRHQISPAGKGLGILRLSRE